ncbi:DUF2690 domain-containing protein [Streptomyces sp. NPDC059835]|uniref:helix-turn-helix domain-containing protein n=1 Tax=Streptomyces sp. NPDC059835 TaxID=3346967 RepID=UPI00364B0946
MQQNRPVGQAGEPEPGASPARVELARLLQQWRKEADKAPTQETVARHVNLNQGTLSRYETAKQDVPEPVIRSLAEYYKRTDEDLVRALNLKTCSTEEPPGDSAGRDTAPDVRAGHGRTGKTLLLGTVAAAVLVGGAVAATLYLSDSGTGTPASSASSAVSVPRAAVPTASCSGSTCVHAEPTATVCQNDAVTTAEGRDFGVHIELRYSPGCHAAWGKLTGSSPGDRVQVFGKEGNPPHQEEYRQQTGRTAHTQMVEASGPNDGRACAVIDSRGTVCASPLPSAGTGAPTPR